MEDHKKTKAELIDELVRTRQRIAEIGHKDAPRSEAQETEEPHRMAIDCPSGDGTAIVRDGNLLYVDGKFLQIFGYGSADEVIGRPMSTTAHPDDRERVSEYARSGQRGENLPTPYEFLGARKDGTPIHVEAYPMYTSFGGESVSLIYLRDITARKQALETLEKRLRAEEFISAISTRFIDAGAHEIDKRVQDAMRTIGEFTGTDDVYLMLFPLNGTLPQRGYDWHREDLGPRSKEKPQLLPLPWAVERLAQTDMMSVPGKESLPLEAGTERRTWEALGIASVLAIPMNAAGRLIGCIAFPSREKVMGWTEEDVIALKLVGGILATVLSRKESAEARAADAERIKADLRAAEQAREESESRFMSLAEQSTTGVFLIQDNVFRYVNDRLSGMFGYGAGDMISAMGLEDLVSPEDHQTVAESIRKMASGEIESLHCEFTGPRMDGKTVSVEAYVSAVKYRGRPAVIGTLLDESDRKKLEAQLIQSEKMKAIGTLAGGIAHDFNNILMAIQGYTSLMLHHLESSHIHFSKLKGIEDLVESGSDLTKQLLGFASGGAYEIRPTDLNEIVRKTSTMFARTRKEITIQSRYEGDPCVVDGDSGQIEQMLLNLYVNAWQAMPAGGTLVLATENVTLDKKFVRPYGAKPGKYAKISVADSGVGMDEKTRERIFEPFFTTKKRAMGTGLGLSSVYNIVKGHNGIITVASEKGCGATFCIFLPLSKRTVEKVEPASRAVLKGVETVLLVDDEETVVSVSKDMLEALGYSVLIARSGQEAIAIFEEEHHRIDLVILDVIMPDMGGAETFEEIRRIDPSARVILSSGYSLDGLAAKIMERGCKAFIQKPFTINILSQKLRDVLGRS